MQPGLTLPPLRSPGLPVPAPVARSGVETKADKAFNISQGTKFIPKIVGDFAKAEQIAINNAASGKFADEPLGLYDPGSPQSGVIEALLPRPLTDYRNPETARLADTESNAWGTVNTVAKSVGYLTGIFGNIVTYSTILGVEDPKHRALLFYKNTGDLLQNLSWLGEKILVIPTTAAVAFGDYQTALLLRLGGHVLSNGGWASGFFGAVNMVRDEAHLYLASQDSSSQNVPYEINQANIQNAATNLAYAVPRIGAQSIVFFSGASMYLGGEAMESAYRVVNGAYNVPLPLVGVFILFSAIPPLLSLTLSGLKMKARSASTFTDRLQDACSIAGNLGLLASAVAVCYIPSDPHSMLFSVAGTSFLVGQYLIKERSTLKTLPSLLLTGARNFALGTASAVRHPGQFLLKSGARARDLAEGVGAMGQLSLEIAGLKSRSLNFTAREKTSWRSEWNDMKLFIIAVVADARKKN